MSEKIYKCKGCGSFLTGDVENCPNCGCNSQFFVVYEENSQEEKNTENKENSKKERKKGKKQISKKRKTIGISILAIIILIIVIGIISEDKNIKEKRNTIDLYDVIYSDNPKEYYEDSDEVIAYIDKQNRVYVSIDDNYKLAHIDKENVTDYNYVRENYSISGLHLGDDINSVNSSKYSLVYHDNTSDVEEYIFDDLNKNDAYLNIKTIESKIVLLEYSWMPGSDDDFNTETTEKTTEEKQTTEKITTEATENNTTEQLETTEETNEYSSDYINDILDTWVTQSDYYATGSMMMTTLQIQVSKFYNDYGIGYFMNFTKYDEYTDSYYYETFEPYSYDGTNLYCISEDGIVIQISNNYDGSLEVISDTIFSGTYWNVNLF
ncbi:MAG: hypothetical protein IJ141_01995 [Lachnospiraceae bacterium]|nr:hypothetical protein [Lachnospiraceae bacterium]